MHFFHRALSTLRDLPPRLLPGACALCGANQAGLLCDACQQRYVNHQRFRCACCAIDMTTTHFRCGRCYAEPPMFDASVVASSYAPPIDRLVQSLKFGGQLPYAALFARLLLQAVPNEAIADAELLVAVPLSAERLALRGFNQAHEIAKPLAHAWRLPLATHVCLRVRDTEPQSALAPERRRDNMHGAFAIAHRAAVAGKHVLVVDDVMTTGHTLNALAACLKRHGATRVTNLVVARTPLR